MEDSRTTTPRLGYHCMIYVRVRRGAIKTTSSDLIVSSLDQFRLGVELMARLVVFSDLQRMG